ncbi:family S53 protease-like protein [Akanthomyces lecanii RCEF 1005]|uniref:Family S53 protease-like protein n=1 Tax=Akanthomyces lecanii RCEF 1005 TaxID=1081108 RepID=A0A162LS30_CORDF|nr:family S53 protease-like protein [Akanthomyces lecanii RCEF 1005]
MVSFSKIAFLASLANTAWSSPVDTAASPLALFHELKSIPSQWVSKGQADKNVPIKVQIGLKQSNIQGLQEKLLDISNPSSPNYGKWLSKEEVASYTAPAAGNVEAVKAWLASNGVTEVSQPTNDWVEFTAPVSVMEKLLGTTYQMYTHPDSASAQGIPRTTEYSVPRNLHSIIDMVTPTTAFYNPVKPVAEKGAKVSVGKRATCDPSAITPSCINSLYDVDYTSKGNSLVASTLLIGLAASHSDYSTFSSDFAPGLQDFQDISVSSGSNPGSGDQNTLLEGNLDTQYVGGVAYPNPSELLAVGPETNSGFADEIANLASYLTSASNPPTAVSTSYDGEEQGFDGSYMDRVCNEFMKAGSQGISVFFSTGDYGVGGIGESSCSQGFYANWPPSCPWVTAIGGTQFDNNNNEVVADFSPQITSPGGGYSNHFSAPDYNKDVTSAYANSLDSSFNGYFNPSGRGYPDISLVSKNYQVIVNGQTLFARGTSASSPSWAALVSVLNDYRQSEGKPNLGFINPLLYSQNASAAIRDVTSGNNYGCDSNGYSAATGWDAASGLGTFDFAKLRALL